MQKQISNNSYSKSDYNTQPVQIKLGCSDYVVNNSFHANLQPKRASIDIKFYMQLHTKFLRRAIIEKRFDQNLNEFVIHPSNTRRGFRGSILPESVQRRKTISHRQTRAVTENTEEVKKAPYNSKEVQNFTLRDSKDAYEHQKAQKSHLKPNMMYNLNLYRKRYRANENKYQRQGQSYIFDKDNKDKQVLYDQKYKTYNLKLKTAV